jgi:predicted molibdopterin-dependent oxidoreductase YjgC
MSDVRFTFDGVEMKAAAGSTVAAALIAQGILSWRSTRHEAAPRGLFCGIGQCFDCLITINGKAEIRACLDIIQDGDVLTTQQSHGHAH